MVTLTLTDNELEALSSAIDCPLSGDRNDAIAVFGPKRAVLKAAKTAQEKIDKLRAKRILAERG